MNALITLYNSMSDTERVFNKYTSTAKKNLGTKFSFIGTNSRGILPKKGKSYGGFYQAFKVIKEVNLIPRDQWSRTNPGGQSLEKQHTSRMRESEFFMVRNNAFILTSRGIVFEKMVLSDTLTDHEKNILCYILILSSYFSKTPNYIIKQTDHIFKGLLEQKISYQNALDYIEKFLISSQRKGFKKVDSFLYDYTYIDTFAFDFEGLNFLENYFSFSEEDRTEFKNYIYQGTPTSQTGKCIIKKKFAQGGNYTNLSLIDNAWILYVTQNLIINFDNINSFDSFINNILESYSKIYTVNISEIKSFVYNTEKNKSVFNVIYSQVFDLPILRYEVEKDLTEEEINNLGVIDSTDEIGRLQSDRVVVSLKKLAKSQSNHLCECDELEGCKYFTSRENNENFLEIHHLIPREFANDFDVTIEVLENYVALCPNCHRKIHLAVDRERSHLLKMLLNKRKIKLANTGLNITEKELFDYYGFNK